MSDIAAEIERFDFRHVHPQLFMGTMSDRYAGWIGQIYSEDRYAGRITQRSKRLRGNLFTEEVLPVESVTEYFAHFPALEIDFTFYRPLMDAKGNPTQNYHVLKTYQQHLQKTDRVFLKVPQIVFARKLRRKGSYSENENYLNHDIFNQGFYAPANHILGENLSGFIFEQEYQRKDAQTEPEKMAQELDDFFQLIPQDKRFHVEIRTDRLITGPVLEVLKQNHIGLVLSHWTWLPSLRRQFEKSGGGLFSGDNSLVIRLVTPRGKTYEDTYTAAFPFDSMIDGMLLDSTVEETVEIIRGVVQRGSQLYLFVNNRAGGNAPQIAQCLAGAFRGRG